MKNIKTIVTLSPSERRQVENEVVFRRANEKVQNSLDKLEKIAREERDDSFKSHPDMTLHFYCECSDENCRERIVLSLSKYQELHKDRSQFIVMPKHDIPSLEKVVSNKFKYSVVDKFVTPSEAANSLNVTSIQNT
ncbi:MAG: hypothetical protein V4702_01680 [Patescibacteria group bacterium]